MLLVSVLSGRLVSLPRSLLELPILALMRPRPVVPMVLRMRRVLKLRCLLGSPMAVGLPLGASRPLRAIDGQCLFCFRTSEQILGLSTQIGDLQAHQVLCRLHSLVKLSDGFIFSNSFATVLLAFSGSKTMFRNLCPAL
jgi:hypothetical protein